MSGGITFNLFPSAQIVTIFKANNSSGRLYKLLLLIYNRVRELDELMDGGMTLILLLSNSIKNISLFPLMYSIYCFLNSVD